MVLNDQPIIDENFVELFSRQYYVSNASYIIDPSCD